MANIAYTATSRTPSNQVTITVFRYGIDRESHPRHSYQLQRVGKDQVHRVPCEIRQDHQEGWRYEEGHLYG
jgi:hypothetical protein